MSVDPCQYIFLNQGLRMSTGKAAAQAAHAAIGGYNLTPADSNIKRLFHRCGHEKTVVLTARDEPHMWTIKAYLRQRGIRAAMVIDEGRTEIQPMTPTAIGVEVLDKNHPHNAGIFAEFDLYSDLPAEFEWKPVDPAIIKAFQQPHNPPREGRIRRLLTRPRVQPPVYCEEHLSGGKGTTILPTDAAVQLRVGGLPTLGWPHDDEDGIPLE